MNQRNRRLSVFAYYLSKFDLDAVKALGYKNQVAAMHDISEKIGNGNTYLKQRRDEFDVLTGSHRRGYANREPVRSVLELHEQLKDVSFEDLTSICIQFLNPSPCELAPEIQKAAFRVGPNFSDAEIEAIVNARDDDSAIVIQQTNQKVRIYNPQIPNSLKKLYHYQCQICGYSANEYGTHIAEAHHIIPFSESQNNNPDNIIILCPNHHRLIHKAAPTFDKTQKVFVFRNGISLQISMNLHL